MTANNRPPRNAVVRWLWQAGLLAALAAAGCATPIKGLYPPPSGEPTRSVYVVGHGLHTTIALNWADIPAAVWPESAHFPDAAYLDVGWGEAVFYPDPSPNLWEICKAAFWPTPSVLHVAGLPEPPQDFFETGTIIEVQLSETGFRRLCQFIADSYERDRDAQPIPVGPGQYGDSRFYRARGKFYFPNTCNVWVARALRTAGCPITVAYTSTAGNVRYQTRKFGKVLRPLRSRR